MRVKHAELTKIYQILMDALADSDIISKDNDIDFFYDYYWSISLGERHNLNSQPELDIGSIAHDLERIRQCISDNDPVSEQFRWLGNVLIAIADTFNHHINQGKSIGL